MTALSRLSALLLATLLLAPPVPAHQQKESITRVLFNPRTGNIEVMHRFLSLTLSHDALRDVWPEQVNLVNVERDKTVRSATFDRGRREATIRF